MYKYIRTLNKIYADRGDKVELYSDLLSLPTKIMYETIMANRDVSDEDPVINNLRTLNGGAETNYLTTKSSSGRYIFWSTSRGSTIKKKELVTLAKILGGDFNMTYVSIYRKKNPFIDGLEFYNLDEIILLPRDSVYGSHSERMIKPVELLRDKLPLIFADDPVVKTSGAQVGEVLRFDRAQCLAEINLDNHYYYREVVNKKDPNKYVIKMKNDDGSKRDKKDKKSQM